MTGPAVVPTLRDRPAVRLLVSEAALAGWLGQAAHGEVLEYHRGFLLRDHHPQAGRLPESDRAELARVGHRAWWAAEHGLAHLAQRRHGEDDYSYQLIARPRSPRAGVPLSILFAMEAA